LVGMFDCLCMCAKGQRRSAKSPTAVRPAKPVGDQTGAVATANQTGAGAGPSANDQQAMVSDAERNVMLQQQREQLQAQLVLQQQLHSELQQHLKLQQEHHQLQAQLMVTTTPATTTTTTTAFLFNLDTFTVTPGYASLQ